MAQVELDPAGVRDLLRSAEVEADITRRAEAVADAARSQNIRVSGVPGADELPIRVRVHRGPNRVSARVAVDHPAGLAVEAKHRLLGRALDAAQ
jgi:hypothetical protein